jgi:hypothetical protein
MIYEKRITIPPNTSQASPTTAEILVHPGMLRMVEVTFPPGPAGLAHLQINKWERQEYPTNPNSDFAGDGVQLVFNEDALLIDPPYVYTLVGWNEDDTYEHTITVRMLVIPFDLLAAASGAQSSAGADKFPAWLVGV